jgi:hypothetical protein
MANEKETKELESVIEQLEKVSKSVLKAYPTLSMLLQYSADYFKPFVADLKGREQPQNTQGRPWSLEQERARMRAAGKVI